MIIIPSTAVIPLALNYKIDSVDIIIAAR